MKHIEIENHPNKAITFRLQTRPSGDIEFVRSVMKPDVMKRAGVEIGGVCDETIAVLPKDRRCDVAHFLVNA